MSDFGNPNSFSSPYFEIDTVELPSIRAGGPSNSNILNRFLRSLQEDMIRLGGQLALLQLNQQYLAQALLTQSAAYGMPWALATQVVSSMAATGDIIWLDGHASSYLTENTEADHKTKFGQWTLPVTAESDLLFASDIYGNPWISSEAAIRFLEAEDDTEIEDSSLQTALDSSDLLTTKGIWLQPESTKSYKWIQLDAPLQYQNLPATCIEFDPMPCYGTTLCEVKVLSTSWETLDLSYITGWDGIEVPNCGPVRLFFDTQDIRSIRILLKVESGAWGLGTLRLKHLEFASTGKLEWTLPGSRDINFGRLGGKNSEDLSSLSQTINASTYTVNLTSPDVYSSPIVTNAIIKFNV